MQVNALQFDDENGYSAKIVAGSECLDSGGVYLMCSFQKRKMSFGRIVEN